MYEGRISKWEDLKGKFLFGHCEGKADQVVLGEGEVLSLDRNQSSALDFDYDNHLVSRTDLNFLPQRQAKYKTMFTD